MMEDLIVQYEKVISKKRKVKSGLELWKER